jgi:hypothetical protein
VLDRLILALVAIVLVGTMLSSIVEGPRWAGALALGIGWLILRGEERRG